MNESPKCYDEAHALVVTLLNKNPIRSPQAIRDAITRISALFPADAFDADAMVAQLMHEGNVHVPDATLMVDPEKHDEWLPYKRGKVDWRFWRRYETYLEQDKKLPHPVVQALGKLTDDILGQLEDPERKPRWDCRGMVVGSVQSGKTANYCGLICKAIDSGYRLIVVLAGMHNNLRSQTQFRLDEGVLGRDSQHDRNLDQSSSLIGVGRLFGQRLPLNTLTTSADDGDFRAARADTNVFIGSDPVILVVKKNGSVLKNLLKWVLHVRGEDVGRDKKIVRGVPLLVIDDEADNASINTKDKDEDGNSNDVTAINGRIRELLDAFEKSAYVGYTATPFANIFINPDAETPQHGDDLFPRSFILNVSPPSNYVSPARVFGLEGDPHAEIAPKPALPLVKLVDDFAEIFPPKHKKDLTVGRLPASLLESLLAFVLVCAARRARGQRDVHNSMLVHVTRFVNVQHQVAQLVQQEIDAIRRKLQLGEGARKDTLIKELKQLWDDEFVPKSTEIRNRSPDENLPAVSWTQVAAELPEAVGRIEIKEINGHATDVLDYVTHRHGYSVVAVGGDKLSRGLTLEGLSVSYFLRTTRMYDTLMQMGRWFGYRPGYLDLCRLYTTDDLRRWYRHVALAEVELRREFDRMKKAGLTPRRYGLRVREHPGGLLITALNKMAHGRTRKLSYAGQLVQTPAFKTSLSIVQANRVAISEFLAALGGRNSAEEMSSAWLWRDVPAQRLLDELMSKFDVAAENWRLQKPELMEFIRRQAADEELSHWNIALVHKKSASESPCRIADVDVGATTRSPENDSWPSGSTPSLFVTSNSNIQDPAHHTLDLVTWKLDEPVLDGLLGKRVEKDGEPLFAPAEALWLTSQVGRPLHDLAVELTERRHPRPPDASGKQEPRGEVARHLRPKTHGLLTIYPLLPKGIASWPVDEPFMGLAFSFPSSDTARAVDYKVNKVWQATFRDDDYDDEG